MNEDAGTVTVCVTKDKITAIPITVLLTAHESTPISAVGMSNGYLYTVSYLSNLDALGQKNVPLLVKISVVHESDY